MKNQAENKYKIIALIWAVLGALFAAGGAVVHAGKDRIPQLPRADIAHIGFWVVGAVFLIVAIAVYCMAKDKKALIEEKDERSQMIAGKAGNLAYMVQTVLLSAASFLLCFMGYLSAVAMITLTCAIVISAALYILTAGICRRRM